MEFKYEVLVYGGGGQTLHISLTSIHSTCLAMERTYGLLD